MSGNFVANCLSGSSAMQGLWLQWKFVAMEMHSVFPVCRCPFLSGLSVTPKNSVTWVTNGRLLLPTALHRSPDSQDSICRV